MTSLAPSPDGDPASQKLKQVSKVYADRVKFLQIYGRMLYIVGSELHEETKDFSSKQVTVMQQSDCKILARLRFNEEIVFFKIQAQILIVSSGGGLYIFSLRNMKKIESLHCSAVFASFMSMAPDSKGDQFDFLRLIYSDPNEVGRLSIYSCK